MQGRIIENISNIYKISLDKKIYTAVARGKMKKEAISPVVGDIVEFTIIENNNAVIEKIYPRKTYIKRPKISNISQIFLVVSLQNPKPDLLLLDKQLAFAEFCNIKPIIVLNKIDLDEKQQKNKIKKIYENIGYIVLETEAKNKKGIQNLIKQFEGNINAFSGNSGVGKSTLINAIFEEEKTLEGIISERNKKGKNTTTAIKLYDINDNTFIADTPGFSTFDISEIDYRTLDKYFIEFKEEIYNCDFVGCSHIKEQNCGIKRAISEGKISKERYERYCKLYLQLKSNKTVMFN